MARLSVEQIVAADDLGQEEVEVPEWEGTVLIRGLGYAEWVDLRDASIVGGQQDEKLFSRLLLSTALVEPEVTPEQADLLLAKSTPAVTKIADRILALSKIMPDSMTESEATFPG